MSLTRCGARHWPEAGAGPKHIVRRVGDVTHKPVYLREVLATGAIDRTVIGSFSMAMAGVPVAALFDDAHQFSDRSNALIDARAGTPPDHRPVPAGICRQSWRPARHLRSGAISPSSVRRATARHPHLL